MKRQPQHATGGYLGSSNPEGKAKVKALEAREKTDSESAASVPA